MRRKSGRARIQKRIERKRARRSRSFRANCAAKFRSNCAATYGGKLRHQAKNLERSRTTVRIFAPVEFDIADPYYRGSLCEMLRQMRQSLLAGNKVLIDLSRTKLMRPGGTILFLAELDRIERCVGKRRVRGTRPRDPVVEQVCQQIGLSRFLQVSERLQTDSFADSVKYWKFASATQSLGEAVQPMLQPATGELDQILSRRLYAGIVEAMENCLLHAYMDTRGDGIPQAHAGRMGKRWWMFSESKPGTHSVVFCDLGIGILRSLESSQKWRRKFRELTARIISKTPKSAAIEAAVNLHETRTHEPNRGKGLGDIFEVIVNSQSGHVRIFSGKGAYSRSAKPSTKMKDYEEDIMGTIVEWTIPVKEDV